MYQPSNTYHIDHNLHMKPSLHTCQFSCSPTHRRGRSRSICWCWPSYYWMLPLLFLQLKLLSVKVPPPQHVYSPLQFQNKKYQKVESRLKSVLSSQYASQMSYVHYGVRHTVRWAQHWRGRRRTNFTSTTTKTQTCTHTPTQGHRQRCSDHRLRQLSKAVVMALAVRARHQAEVCCVSDWDGKLSQDVSCSVHRKLHQEQRPSQHHHATLSKASAAILVHIGTKAAAD